MTVKSTPSPTIKNQVPIDKSKTLSRRAERRLKRKLKKQNKKQKTKAYVLSDADRTILGEPRQSIFKLEPIIRAFLKGIYNKERAAKVFSVEDEAKWQAELSEIVDGIIYGESLNRSSVIRKRNRLRFLAKYIVLNKVNTVKDCENVSLLATEIDTINKTKGLIGFFLDDYAIFHMTLKFFTDLLATYQSSFAGLILNSLVDSLVVVAAIIQVLSIISENKPLRLEDYAKISFIFTVTSLSLIAYCTGAVFVSVIASSLSIAKNLVVFTDELYQYQNCAAGSDKQKSHAQACISALNDIILSTLALSVILAVCLVPMPGLLLTGFIITLTILKVSWNLASSEQRMYIKRQLSLDKEDYQEVLDKAEPVVVNNDSDKAIATLSQADLQPMTGSTTSK